jgi:hypothetical protein
MKFIAQIIVGALLLFVLGCANQPGRAYKGDPKSPEQVARFECGFGIRLRAIDGDRQYQGDPVTCMFDVLPGNHEFTVNFYESNNQYRAPNEFVLPLQLVAGRRYVLNAFVDKSNATGWRVSLLDSTQKNLITITDYRELK